MLDKELKDILRQTLQATGARAARVVHDEPAAVGHIRPLGAGAFLHVELDTELEELEPLGAALERTARALRACARRYAVSPVPEIAVSPGDNTPRERVLERVKAYLSALCNVQYTLNTAVVHHGNLVSTAHELDELQESRLPFLVRLVDAESQKRSASSHADVWGQDYYARSFYYGACIIAFFDGPFALDFFRHRTRMVARELCALLPMLDDPPPSPAQIAPRPQD